MKADPVLTRLQKLEEDAYLAWHQTVLLVGEYLKCQEKKAKAEQAKQARRAA